MKISSFSLREASFARLALVVCAVLAFLCVTRIPLAPKYLYYFDSVNFALALEHFDPALHQPQPPGYPLHVLFTRLLHAFIPKPEHVFIAAGLVAAAIALIAQWALGEAMFGVRAGISAALLLGTNPAFWLAGISNQVRLWLAVGGALIALVCWNAMTERHKGWRVIFAAGLAGLMAGFRPGLLLFAAPLLVMTAIVTRPRRRDLAAAVIALTAAVGGWLWFTVDASGGWQSYLSLVLGYADREFSPASTLLGAPYEPARTMVMAAMVWNGIGVLSWIWVLLFHRPSPRPEIARFMAAWALPPFLFHCLVHVGDPDHTLATAPALCLAGGAAIASLSRRLTSEGWVISNMFAAAINVAIFFLPLGGLAGAATYRAVEYVDRSTRDTFDAIRTLSERNSVSIVCHECFVTERHLQYYFPSVPVLAVPRLAAGPVRLYIHGRPRQTEVRDGAIAVPHAERIIWIFSPWPGPGLPAVQRQVDLRQEGPVYWHSLDRPAMVELGGARLLLAAAASRQ